MNQFMTKVIKHELFAGFFLFVVLSYLFLKFWWHFLGPETLPWRGVLLCFGAMLIWCGAVISTAFHWIVSALKKSGNYRTKL